MKATMNATKVLQKVSIQELVKRIFAVGGISRADQMILMAQSSITPEDKILIDHVFNALQRGELKVL